MVAKTARDVLYWCHKTTSEGGIQMANETIGQRIAQKRKSLDLSQEALGDLLEVSRQAVSKWESEVSHS